MATFDLPPDYGPARDAAILAHAAAGDLEVPWTSLNVAGRIDLTVTGDSVKLAGVRINVSAELQQQLADAFGALLPTPKIMDLMWLARAATIEPVVMPISSSTAAMVQASAGIDAQIDAQVGALAAVAHRAAGSASGIFVSQKTWCIGNSLAAHPGKALNYGFFCIPDSGTSWRGIATEACVSIADPTQGRVIQGQGWAHGVTHEDYSQCCWLVHRQCVVDGTPRDLVDVLQDPSVASLLSHEGPLTVLRQLGVDVYSLPPLVSRLPSGTGLLAGTLIGAAAGAALWAAGPMGAVVGAAGGIVFDWLRGRRV